MSDSESSSQQSTSQQDNRNVLGQSAVLAQGGSTINVQTLDASVANNAIDSTTDASIKNLKQSLTFGSDALDFGSGALNKAFSFGSSVLTQNAASESRVLDSIGQSANLVKDAYADAKGRGALTDKILIGAIAMAGIVAFAAVSKK